MGKLLQFFLSHFLLVSLCSCFWSLLRSNPSYGPKGTRGGVSILWKGYIVNIKKRQLLDSTAHCDLGVFKKQPIGSKE